MAEPVRLLKVGEESTPGEGDRAWALVDPSGWTYTDPDSILTGAPSYNAGTGELTWTLSAASSAVNSFGGTTPTRAAGLVAPTAFQLPDGSDLEPAIHRTIHEFLVEFGTNNNIHQLLGVGFLEVGKTFQSALAGIVVGGARGGGATDATYAYYAAVGASSVVGSTSAVNKMLCVIGTLPGTTNGGRYLYSSAAVQRATVSGEDILQFLSPSSREGSQVQTGYNGPMAMGILLGRRITSAGGTVTAKIWHRLASYTPVEAGDFP